MVSDKVKRSVGFPIIECFYSFNNRERKANIYRKRGYIVETVDSPSGHTPIAGKTLLVYWLTAYEK